MTIRNYPDDVAHRPWPLPAGPWRMAMVWHDLLFMHWPVPPSDLRRLIPPSLELDTFDGRAWLAVTPLRMRGVRHRLSPALPWLSAFPEINVRTYVRANGKPGVWFFSLDVPNPLAVWGARWTYRLAYYRAHMDAAAVGGWIRYFSQRTHRGAPAAGFAARYRPAGEVFQSSPGSLDHWLTERYCLYAADRRGRPYRAEIHHAPWPLQAAKAEVERNTMPDGLRVKMPDAPPLLHFAAYLDVVAWPLEPV